jgi:hypothetical protein
MNRRICRLRCGAGLPGLLLVFLACDRLSEPLEAPVSGTMVVLSWPGILIPGDSALAHVVVVDSAGRQLPAVQYEWRIDPVSVAGLHGHSSPSQRRVLAFQAGTATLRVRAFVVVGGGCYSVPGGLTGTSVVCSLGIPVTLADSTRPVTVISG